MKMWNKKKEKIEFFNDEYDITENYPILESKNFKPKWIENVRKDLENSIKEGSLNVPGFSHIARCPGIFDLFKYGYVIPLHRDIIIIPHEKGFEWCMPGVQEYDGELSNKCGIIGNKVMVKSPGKIESIDQTSFSLISKPPWTSGFMFKINTGWNVISPKGVKFIMLPIAYPDTFEFTSTIGILDPSINTQINFQMYWNGTKEETIIKAGTPLGQLIPLTEKKYKMVQRKMNQQDREWTLKKHHTYYSSTFWPYQMRKKVSEIYNKYWHGEK